LVPRVHRALYWRRVLAHLFATLEAALSLVILRKQPMQLADIREYVGAVTGKAISDQSLGQILSAARGMLTVTNSSCHGLCLERTGVTSETLPLQELLARHDTFEATLAGLTDVLACDQVPCMSLPSRPLGRSLSRQTSVCIDTKPQAARLGRQLQAYQGAQKARRFVDESLRIVQGALAVVALLDSRFPVEPSQSPLRHRRKGICEEDLVRLLISHYWRTRLGCPLRSLPEAKVALAHVIPRAVGWISVESSNSGVCLRMVAGGSSAAVSHLLENEKRYLEQRQDVHRSLLQSAFLASIPTCFESGLEQDAQGA